MIEKAYIHIYIYIYFYKHTIIYIYLYINIDIIVAVSILFYCLNESETGHQIYKPLMIFFISHEQKYPENPGTTETGYFGGSPKNTPAIQGSNPLPLEGPS